MESKEDTWFRIIQNYQIVRQYSPNMTKEVDTGTFDPMMHTYIIFRLPDGKPKNYGFPGIDMPNFLSFNYRYTVLFRVVANSVSPSVIKAGVYGSAGMDSYSEAFLAYLVPDSEYGKQQAVEETNYVILHIPSYYNKSFNYPYTNIWRLDGYDSTGKYHSPHMDIRS